MCTHRRYGGDRVEHWPSLLHKYVLLCLASTHFQKSSYKMPFSELAACCNQPCLRCSSTYSTQATLRHDHQGMYRPLASADLERVLSTNGLEASTSHCPSEPAPAPDGAWRHDQTGLHSGRRSCHASLLALQRLLASHGEQGHTLDLLGAACRRKPHQKVTLPHILQLVGWVRLVPVIQVQRCSRSATLCADSPLLWSLQH